ncbi:hypothetical protein HYH03_006649 [Edaphochlamys debaryana]|uniref:SAC domain-containing protein n=1 Tax=Edaphochlamys debaryana TaxID=47281 RepID=A0A835Y741_9CHLO|nr:hypothetical protein HYH03_006649 [Edaphochlamys debaryana]|eukprot:KAG2495381.1 hypothetical protein HYH03_006649 [Edaphochlamys debaryana]
MPKGKQPPSQPASSKALPSLGLLRFKTDGSTVALQHVAHGGSPSEGRVPPVPTLRVDLKTGKVSVGSQPPLPEEGSGMALGLAGLLRLERGAVLALVSKAKRVCGMLDGPVYKVEATSLIAPETINASDNDLRYATLIQSALHPPSYGGHLYFSHTANITSSRQRQADVEGGHLAAARAAAAAEGPPPGAPPPLGRWWDTAAPLEALGAGGAGSAWSRADPRFTWNRELMKPIIDGGGEAFALPLMAGYVGQAVGATFLVRAPGAGGGAEGDVRRPADPASDAPPPPGFVACRGDMTLITRLGVGRPVAGGWRRGLDAQGNAAGFAETELVLALWAPEGEAAGGPAVGLTPEEADAAQAGDGIVRRRSRVAVASYVMARGSVPLFWAAPPNMLPSPAPRGPLEASAHAPAFAAHVGALNKAYGKPALLLHLMAGPHRDWALRLHDCLQELTACAPVPPTPGPGPAAVAVGLPLGPGDMAGLAAAAGAGAAGAAGGVCSRLEGALGEALPGMGVYVAVEEMEMATPLSAPAPPGAVPGSQPAGPSPSRLSHVGRSVRWRQRGVVEACAASNASAGGCCEEVDLAQHCLALPALAACLGALGALEEVGELGRAHAKVVHALAVLWSHNADVLSDAAHGTPSTAGRALRAAAGRLEAGGALGGLKALVRAPWGVMQGVGDSLSRYYYACFQDAKRQDALDLASGAYKMSSPPAHLSVRQPPNTATLQLGILLLLAGLAQIILAVLSIAPPADAVQLALRVVVPLGGGAALLADVARRGAAGSYVERPLLRPGAVFPWGDLPGGAGVAHT